MNDNWESYFRKNKKAADKHHRKFKEVFGVNLMHYFAFSTGLDIGDFDERVIKSPDGMSLEETIQERYGDEAVAMVRELL